MTDHHQVLTRMIAAAQGDGVARRTYVYELARIRLLKFASSQVPPWSNTRILKELQALDRAIEQVEAWSSEHRREPPEPAASAPPDPVVPRSDVAQPSELSRIPPLPTQWTGMLIRLGALMAVLLVALGVFLSLRFDGPSDRNAAARLREAPAAPVTQNAPPRAEPQDPPATAPDRAEAVLSPAAVPDRYGVYALRGEQLIELTDLLPRQPGRGTGNDAAVVEPSRLRFPDGHLTFVIRRREFIASTPDRIPIRVVARIAREYVLDRGRKAATPLSGLWLLRPVGSEFQVTPVPDRLDTILVRSDPPDAALPPGRYVLMLYGEAYDFTVEGSVTDPAHCVERTASATEDTYEQCPLESNGSPAGRKR